MSTYAVNPAIVNPVISDFEQAGQDIQSAITDLKTDLAAHLAEWETPEAKVAYTQAQTKWDEAGQHMPILLKVMRDTLDGVVNDYQTAEKVGAGLFDG